MRLWYGLRVLSLLGLLLWPPLASALSETFAWDFTQCTDTTQCSLAVGFNLYRQTAVAGACSGLYTKLTATVLPLTTLTYIDASGLLAGQTYCWQVRAIDANNQESVSDMAHTLIYTIPQPASPTGLAAIYVGGGVTLTWGYTATADPAVSFAVYKQVSCLGTWVKLGTTPVATPNWRDTAFLLTQTVCYRVTSVDANGGESVATATLTFSMPKPPQPQNLRGTVGP